MKTLFLALVLTCAVASYAKPMDTYYMVDIDDEVTDGELDVVPMAKVVEHQEPLARVRRSAHHHHYYPPYPYRPVRRVAVAAGTGAYLGARRGSYYG